MKKLIAIASVIGLLALSASAQVGPASDTNSTTVKQFLIDAYNFTLGDGLTNLSVSTVATYTPSIKQWGGGVVVARNLPIGSALSTGLGIGMDYYNRQFYALNGQISLQADIYPFTSLAGTNTTGFAAWLGKVKASPFAAVMLGKPFGNQTGGADGPETIQATGATVSLCKLAGGTFSIGGIYGTRQGLGDASGTFYGGLLNWNRRF